MTRSLLSALLLLAACATSFPAKAADLVLADGGKSEYRIVIAVDASPSTKATLGSNCAHLTARVDPRTGWLIVLCALDNLVKGASGQAVQCANIATGLSEGTGLPVVGVYP